ncbi:MAG: RNA polymerase sigma factor [FCB group bacterium]|nr:RNA polymerase sigma factor [FCB group bacterium]
MTRPQPNTDHQLVTAIQQGDRDSFRELYDRYKDRLFKTSLALGLNRQDAEDVLQESFVKIFQKINTLRNPDRLTSWMYRIVVNTAKSKMKWHQNKWDELNENNSRSDRTTDPANVNHWDELLRALHRLPTGFRNVFVLHAIQDLSQETVADIMGISVGTVKSQYHRSRKKLQTILHEMGIRFENQ